MGATSFGFTYDWNSIEDNLDNLTGGGGPSPSSVVGDDASSAMTADGRLADPAPITDEWQAVIDSVTAQLVIRDRDLVDYLGAWLQVSQMVGNLSAAGTAAAAHGVNGAPSLVLWVGAFYKGAAGQAVPLTVTSVDGTNVNVSGGTAGAAYRVTMIFSAIAAGW